MYKKILLNSLFYIMLATSLVAQNECVIKGRVLDVTTQEPILGANITLLNSNRGSITNEQGYFKLENLKVGTYQLQCSYVGYQTYQQQIVLTTDVEIVDINLKEQTENIEEVVITAKKKIRELREKAMPISVISMNQLSGTVNSISDVLTKTVGVTLRSSGGVGSSSRLSVRGLEGKRIGFFVDETPLNDQSDFIDVNDIPMELIDRIEIYKGVVPAKFGGNSMGGAVNIVIKEYPDKYADFSCTLESYNTHKIETVLKRNLKNKGIVFGIGGGYTYADNDYTMESPYIEGLKIKRNHDRFKKLMIGGNIELKKWWFDKVEFESVLINTYKEIQGVERDIRKAHTKSRAYILANTYEKDDCFIEGLDLDMSLASAYTQYSLIDTAKQWYDWDGKPYNSISKYGGELGNNYASDSNNEKFSVINKLNLVYLVNQQHAVNLNSYLTFANGYPKDELRKLSMQGKETVFNSKIRSWVVGFTYDYRTVNDKFLNSLTIRYYLYTMNTKNAGVINLGEVKNVKLNKNDIGFSNAMRYRFFPDFMVKLSVGYDVRIPSENELLGDGSLIEPSESLMPERNASLNTGFLYDLTGKHRTNLQLELSGFYMYLKDMIRFTPSPWGGARYENFGQMRTIGVEFEAKADIFTSLYGYGNITYQDLRDVRECEEGSTIPNPTKNKRIPNIPYLLANIGLEFHKANLFGGTAQNTRVFSDLAFVEEYLYDFKMTANQRAIPCSTTIDLGVEHSFKNECLFISGKIRNLTDAKVLSEFNRPLPGINFGLKLRYVFK